MSRFKMLAAGCLSAAFVAVGLNAAPAQAITYGSLRSSDVVKTASGGTYIGTIWDVTNDYHHAKLTQNGATVCLIDSTKPSWVSADATYKDVTRGITVYKVSCSNPMPAGVRW